jgi:hypothetical protein
MRGDNLAEVVALPLRTAPTGPAGAVGRAISGLTSTVRRVTEEPGGEVDEWGRDAGLVRATTLLSEFRWSVIVGGDQRLPRRGGAMIVINARRFSQASVLAALSISQAVDRPVRFAGRRVDTPLSALEQRLGGLIEHPAEIAGALRADQLVVITASTTMGTRNVGEINHHLVRAAVESRAPVFPAAVSSRPFGRHARIEIGNALRPSTRRRGPHAEVELAERLRRSIRMLLDEMGDLETGTPHDWLPLTGMGGR